MPIQADNPLPETITTGGFTMQVRIHKDKFTSIRPWQWWIEDGNGVVNWGGREWTADDAKNAAQNALLRQFSNDVRNDLEGDPDAWYGLRDNKVHP